MSDDSSALSLSEQPPTEVDYEAIHDAVMETQRGRWFLHEYAKRNRNADTGMLLGAIERIEAMLRQRPQPEASPHTPLPAARLPAAPFHELRDMIDRARRNLAAIKSNGGGRPTDFESVASSLKAPVARIRAAIGPLQDTAYAMREEGNADRLCNEIEKRATDLVRDCGEIEQAATDVRHIVVLLRDLTSRIEALGAIEPASASPVTADQMPAPPPAAPELVEPLSEAAPLQAEPVVEPQTIGAGAIPEEAGEPPRETAQAQSEPEQAAPVVAAAAVPQAAAAPPERDALTLDPLMPVEDTAIEAAAPQVTVPDSPPAAFGFEPAVERMTQAVPAIVSPALLAAIAHADDASGKDKPVIAAPEAVAKPEASATLDAIATPEAIATPGADATPGAAAPEAVVTPEAVVMPDAAATREPDATPMPPFVPTPLADPAEFLLEPLPMVAPTPAPSPVVALAPPPPRREASEALAPIVALSDEEKIALFS